MSFSQTCSVCGVGQFLRVEKNGDTTKRVYSCGHGEIIGIVNETVNISENNTTVLVMTFDLYNSVQIGGNISNSDNIEFVIDPANPDCIKQFKIKLTNPSLDDEKKALEKALEITNYLSLMVNRVVKHKHPMTQRIVNGKMTNSISFTASVLVHKNFDLDANFLDSKLLGKNPDFNKRFQLYNDGLKALDNNDFGGAIQSFHQCIENTNVPERKDYLPLRHATSHLRIDDSDAIREINKIGIKIRKGESLNENDPDNQCILKSKAYDLKRIVWHYLSTQLSNL